MRLTIDAELKTSSVTAQLVQLESTGYISAVMCEPREHRLDLCLTRRPGNLRACYHQHWTRERFEPVGQIFMVPAGESLNICGDGDASHISVLCFLRPDCLGKSTDGEPVWKDGELETSLDIKSQAVRELLLRL